MKTQPDTVVIKARPLVYFSKGDERAFFSWLKRIPAVASYRGEGQALLVTVSMAQLNDTTLCELFALYRRYGMTLSPLTKLYRKGTTEWFSRRLKYWPASFQRRISPKRTAARRSLQ